MCARRGLGWGGRRWCARPRSQAEVRRGRSRRRSRCEAGVGGSPRSISTNDEQLNAASRFVVPNWLVNLTPTLLFDQRR
ncbi:hypothetical protein NDU88_011117 [Pleurodeles waltl]|uniref:Uncharacterized protein n=1 Tax=Pleurodeles waltl TaxID=8319 RepID=A0AAV7S078_PLEWA|nr:hypothetical protein NDU88_011117 [Pleurodeles waltl]